MSFMKFDPEGYGNAVSPLLAPRDLAVGPGRPHREAADPLRRLDAETMFGPRRVRDRDMARACLAGLWLYHDFLEESHTISQGIDTPSGSYWHAILHRREGDFANAKYWFRRVGEHFVFPPLQQATATFASMAPAEAAAQLLVTQSHWDASRFVDLCESVVRGRSAAEPLCREIQTCEWQLLFDYCYRRAVE
jgi:hypothetical protein